MRTYRLYRSAATWLLILGVVGLLGFPLELLLMSVFAPPLGEVFFIVVINAYLALAVLATPLGAWLSLAMWWTRRNFFVAIKSAGGSRLPRHLHRAERPTYLLADSVDRELLVALQDSGGDIVEAAHQMGERALISERRDFCRKVANLDQLGLVSLSQQSKRVFLTSAGLDALGMPAALFVSHIPDGVFEYVRREKVKLRTGQWDGVVMETARALEAALTQRLKEEKERFPRRWPQIAEVYPQMEDSFDQVPAGDLRGALERLGILKPASLEDALIRELLKIRKQIHPKGQRIDFGPLQAERCDMFLGVFLRLWYGPLP